MRKILIPILFVIAGTTAAQTIQLDYTASDTYSGDVITGSVLLDLNAGTVLNNHVEVAYGDGALFSTDFSGQTPLQINYNDGTTFQMWIYNSDGTLDRTETKPTSFDPSILVSYHEGGQLLLFLGANSYASVSDPTQAPIITCPLGFGTCHDTTHTQANGEISSLSVTYPSSGVSAVPLPASLWMLAVPILMVATRRRRSS